MKSAMKQKRLIYYFKKGYKVERDIVTKDVNYYLFDLENIKICQVHGNSIVGLITRNKVIESIKDSKYSYKWRGGL